MKTIIGLEIHVQLNTEAKLFCECPTNYGHAEPNTNICPICTGQPGAKPMNINKRAISHVLKIAKMLGAKPVEKEIFVQRKHYFYPDLASGYQRTSKPAAQNGKLNGVRIWEIHFEEDPGRYELKKGYVDYNRSGVPLIEIVTAPDIKDPNDAKKFLSKLESYLRYFDTIKNEVGSIRVDANVSVGGNARVEIKNINSFSNVYDALSFEIKRQNVQIMQGAKLAQETRHFDENSGITIRLRTKESADDYRYVPDPDILPIVISALDWKSAEEEVAELPDIRAERMTRQYKINLSDANVLTIEKEFADAYEELSKKFEPKKLANWMRGPLRKQLNYRNISFMKSQLITVSQNLPVRHTLERLAELYEMFSNGKITDKAAEIILIKMLDAPTQKEKPSDIAKSLGLLKTSDLETAKAACLQAINESPKAIEDYKKGNAKSLFFLVGKVMQNTKGTVDAKEVEKIIKELIASNPSHSKRTS